MGEMGGHDPAQTRELWGQRMKRDGVPPHAAALPSAKSGA